MANIKDVAKASGVSISTVSNVFTNRKSVSAATKKRVLEASRKLNYTPSLIASSMVTKQTNFIGYFFDADNVNYTVADSDLIKGCIIAAADIKKRVITYYDINNQEDLKTALRLGSQPIDGAVLTLPQAHDVRLDNLALESIPFVLIGSPFENDTQISFVDTDNEKLSYDLTQHLIRLGHKRIAFINYYTEYSVSKKRLQGYLKAFNEHKLDVCSQLIQHTGITAQDGIGAAKRLFESKCFFSAVIVSMSEVAAGFYQYLASRGLRVGEDISVVSFNMDTSGLSPALTAANIDYVRLGELSIEVLQKLMVDADHAPYSRTIQDTPILFTDSCAPYSESLFEKFPRDDKQLF